MDIVIRILMGLEFIICILLIGIVLIQRSKGQGVGLSFGGGAEAIFGAQMGNVLTRTTVILGVLFVANTTLLAVLKPTQSTKSVAETSAASVAVPQSPVAGQGVGTPIDVVPSDVLPSVEEVDAAAAAVPEAVEATVNETVEAVEETATEAVQEVPPANEVPEPAATPAEPAATPAEPAATPAESAATPAE